MRTAESRPYRMLRRAEHVDETRQRIVEAAVRLHTTVGAAQTTISALAEEAGVTRLTVYRHFPDEDELFAACRRHWRELHPPPDPGGWLHLPVGEGRFRHALQALYAWYGQHGDALFPIHRDMAAMPRSVQEATRADNDRVAAALVRGSRSRGAARRRQRAAAGHVVSFWTWRSLVIEHGLSDNDAAELAARFLDSADSLR